MHPLKDYIRLLMTTHSSWSGNRKLSVVRDPHIRHFHGHLRLKFATREHLADVGYIKCTYRWRLICWAPAYTNTTVNWTNEWIQMQKKKRPRRTKLTIERWRQRKRHFSSISCGGHGRRPVWRRADWAQGQSSPDEPSRRRSISFGGSLDHPYHPVKQENDKSLYKIRAEYVKSFRLHRL